ncbi:MAG TPA: reverse transcriptase family protein [Planctomycetaceae bacterium]|nr:reverse transcriptase family protein [Planctomycetaceae bacterium]
MGLWNFLKRLLFGAGRRPAGRQISPRHRKASRSRPVLKTLRYKKQYARTKIDPPESATPPYPFARRNPRTGQYLDLSAGTDRDRLRDWNLPELETLDDLARWLELPLGKVAWLTARISYGQSTSTVQQSHYHYCWIKKRRGGERLIESPKPILKAVQHKILREILDRVPVHSDCHSFVAGRSIVTNAEPHVGQRVILKFDLHDFYPSVSINRVTGIFQGMGYCREIALWLARLTTNAIPPHMPFPDSGPAALRPYTRRHLPQGAPTSPALANLSAFALDLRLSGLARSFGANYTRYADDLTFSGPQRLISGLRVLIPLAEKVIRSERFRVHPQKRKVIRNNQRQTVTGVVVNEHPNIGRMEYDRLKAILYNCTRSGPHAQNRNGHDNFQEHLRGRIAQMSQINPARGAKLSALFAKIRW